LNVEEGTMSFFRTVYLMISALLPPIGSKPASPVGADLGEPEDVSLPGGAAQAEPVRSHAPRDADAYDSRHLMEAETLNCTPGQVRGGMSRLINIRGELKLLFPGCQAFAAPALLFRLKREGFSGCTVHASNEGLVVQGRR
jgi:hypothetical protein